ncbi:Tf2-9, partial [Mucuna pruriens]
MRLAKELEAKTLTAKSDLKLKLGWRPPSRNSHSTTHRRGVQRSVIDESISQLAIKEPAVCSVEGKRTWISPLMEYLKDKQLPSDTTEARKVAKDVTRYIIIGGELCRQGFSFPLLQCIESEEAQYVVKEVHERVRDTHIGGRALANKIARAGYYWSTLKNDCVEYVSKICGSEHSTPRVAALYLLALAVPQIGVDILGPFPPTPGQVKYLIVAIIYRFGLPAEIVSNSGTQFASRLTASFYTQLKIKQCFTLVDHPQANGQVEAANRVLWSYHTTPHSSTNETPFRLTFGREAIIPVKIREPSPRITLFWPAESEDELREVRKVVQGGQTPRDPRQFKPHDLVLRKITRTANNNKLTPIWKGSFRITKEVGKGAYRLEQLDGKKIPQIWNMMNLQLYYS